MFRSLRVFMIALVLLFVGCASGDMVNDRTSHTFCDDGRHWHGSPMAAMPHISNERICLDKNSGLQILFRSDIEGEFGLEVYPLEDDDLQWSMPDRTGDESHAVTAFTEIRRGLYHGQIDRRYVGGTHQLVKITTRDHITNYPGGREYLLLNETAAHRGFVIPLYQLDWSKIVRGEMTDETRREKGLMTFREAINKEVERLIAQDRG